ncbi:glycosyltransferase [Novosphingobium sp. EMRT-2]|uniref:glycosyltransferase n=1 Tax=Novosphingobium sp. EMRT-2 TaxID=2571749 RepID=UPI0010BD0548|nr:glycosyltransferase [Novosphingobium sp. EMRT-2]QCI92979.1 glycosyltransferase [Novosphingobium sp. EMRT-2]
MTALALGGLSLAIWLGLIFAHHGFWLTRERDTRGMPPEPAAWPEVVAVVPARDEADVIARSIGSLVAQDYPGRFRVILVDDSSSDGTGDIARALDSDRLEVLTGAPLAKGWTGKLWAVSQGVARAGNAPTYLWLTDADIEHAPDTLRMLVTRGEAGRLALVTLMAKLRCEGLAERMLVPAFVFFFQMLYPFARVNQPTGQGAAAGGCMLVRREALEAAGGIAAIRGALIDDCTLGALLKKQGPVWLGLTDRSRSIRPYDGFEPIAAMISRSAYAQLHYSPVLLAGTIAGLALVYGVPPTLALFGHGLPRGLGLAAWGLMALSFQPMLRFYRRSSLWGLALPVIAAFYAGCTVLSAWQHGRGRGGMWKGRAQAATGT